MYFLHLRDFIINYIDIASLRQVIDKNLNNLSCKAPNLKESKVIYKILHFAFQWDLLGASKLYQNPPWIWPWQNQICFTYKERSNNLLQYNGFLFWMTSQHTKYRKIPFTCVKGIHWMMMTTFVLYTSHKIHLFLKFIETDGISVIDMFYCLLIQISQKISFCNNADVALIVKQMRIFNL